MQRVQQKPYCIKKNKIANKTSQLRIQNTKRLDLLITRVSDCLMLKFGYFCVTKQKKTGSSS